MKTRKQANPPRAKSWSLMGIPDHEGVANVGGRLGAAYGPAAFRKAWTSFSPALSPSAGMDDEGDTQNLTSDVAVNHEIATDRVIKTHRRHGLSVVVGGGHDHGFPHLKGVKAAVSSLLGKSARIGCINIDAHLDVRPPTPRITSGSAFYLAVESGTLDSSRLIEFGVQQPCNASALWEYARAKKIDCVHFDELRQGRAVPMFRKKLDSLAKRCDAIVVSLDLDAVAQAFAPGVSSPQPEGFTPSEIFEMMRLSGLQRKVASLGVFELNPEHDRDAMTARLAAGAVFHFVGAAAEARP